MNVICPTGFNSYVVKLGDSLESIATSFNVTVTVIKDANPNTNFTQLSPGERLCIPQFVQLYPTCPSTNYYVVRSGDTFNSIASKFNLTNETLYFSNFGIDPNSLYLDQILCIPVTEPVYTLQINTTLNLLTLLKNNQPAQTYFITIESTEPIIPKGEFRVLNKQLDVGDYGARWIGLSTPGLGIRSRNEPPFIERLSPTTSFILTNQDAADVFNLTTVGTLVRVTD